MTVSGIWGTDLEIFATSILFDIDTWLSIFRAFNCKMATIFKAGFDISKTSESPSNEGIYSMLQGNHYSPMV